MSRTKVFLFMLLAIAISILTIGFSTAFPKFLPDNEPALVLSMTGSLAVFTIITLTIYKRNALPSTSEDIQSKPFVWALIAGIIVGGVTFTLSAITIMFRGFSF